MVIGKEGRYIFILLTMLVLQIFFYAGCSNTRDGQTGTVNGVATRNDSTKSLDDEETVSELTLKTGPSGKGATWNISGVDRVNRYVTMDGRVIFGDGVMVEGECITDGSTLGEDYDPCFDQVFVLEDKSGKQFEMQAGSIGGDFTEDGKMKAVFKIPFSLADEGQHNDSIRAWSDLIIADPLEDTKDLPGHRVSLAIFDGATV